MQVSIITPSYNQCEFLEQCLESVSSQSEVEYEHIVIDACSTDGSVDLLKSWGDRVRWVSEPDKGQSDAFNKGLRMAQGDIIGWLNSDDLYLKGALKKVISFFDDNSDFDIVYGDITFIDDIGTEFLRRREVVFHSGILKYGHNLFAQPASFYRRQLMTDLDGLDASLQLSMDYDFFLKALAKGARFGYIPEFLASFRFHSHSKSASLHSKMLAEHKIVLDRYKQWNIPGNPKIENMVIAFLRVYFRSLKILKKLIAYKEFTPNVIHKRWYRNSEKT